MTLRQVAAQSFAARMQVFVFFAVGSESQVRQVAAFDLLVGNGNVKAIAELFQGRFVHFFRLVRHVLTFACGTHTVTFNGFCQNQGRTAFGMIHRAVVGVIYFLRVVSASVQCPDFVIGHVGDQCFQFGGIEEMFAHICTVFGFVSLIVAVQTFFHAFAQDAVRIAFQQFVPTAAPDDFHYVPAGAGKVAFQFLNNFAVAADRTVQTLQVAVDDENQIVQTFAGGQCDCALAFRFVHLAVATEHPYFAAFGFGQAARFQIFQETGLINRHQRAETHRYGRELPEIGQQVRVGIRRQAVALGFLTEIVQLLFCQTSFNKGAGIHTRCGVALEEHQIAFLTFAFGFPEMVETDFVHGGRRLERCDVSAQFQIFLTGTQYDGCRVPADKRTDAVLDCLVARNRFFIAFRNGIDIRSSCPVRHTHTVAAAVFHQVFQQVLRTFAAFVFQYRT